jgi:hypothetical protein
MVILWRLKKPVTGTAGAKDVIRLDCPDIDLLSALGEPIPTVAWLSPEPSKMVDR